MPVRFYLIIIIVICNISQNFGQGSWSLAENSPKSERFNDACFINDSVGFVSHRYWIYKTFDYGKSWNQSAKFDKELYTRAIEFLDDSLGFIGSLGTSQTKEGLFRTRNGGRTFEEINYLIGDNKYGICGLDHYKNTIIAAGVFAEPSTFFVSNDRGESWMNRDVPQAKGLVECLAITDSIFLASGTKIDSLGRSVAAIFKTFDQGNSWQVVAENTKAMTYCWKIQMDETGRGIASIEFDKFFYYTEDFGTNWQRRSVGSTVWHYGGAAFFNDSIGWMGNQWNPGMMETKDGGESWSLLNFGTNVNRIIVMKNGTALAFGEKIYRYTQNTLSTEQISYKSKFHDLNVYPNPADNELQIELDLYCSSMVRMDLLNAEGVAVKTIFNDVLNSGKKQINYDVSALPSGAYFIWFRSNEGHSIFKALIQH